MEQVEETPVTFLPTLIDINSSNLNQTNLEDSVYLGFYDRKGNNILNLIILNVTKGTSDSEISQNTVNNEPIIEARGEPETVDALAVRQNRNYTQRVIRDLQQIPPKNASVTSRKHKEKNLKITNYSKPPKSQKVVELLNQMIL